MSFDVDIDCFFDEGARRDDETIAIAVGDEAASSAATTGQTSSAVTLHEVYGFGVDWNDTDRFTISHMFALTK